MLTLSSYENFVDTIWYIRESILSSYLKDVSQFKELKKKMSESYEENQGKGLIVKGRSKKKSSSSKDMSRLKSKHKNIHSFHCHKEGHIRRFYPKRIGTVKRERACL